MTKPSATPEKPNWRERLRVHPAAEVFPRLPKKQLEELASDIREKGGLHEGVTLYLEPDSGEEVLLDGRNRLDAVDLLGDEIFDAKGKVRKEWSGRTLLSGHDPVAWVISANIRRRHLSKREQADLIVAAVKAGTNHRAKSARWVKGKSGSSKDPVKGQVLEEAAKQGISARTATQALVDAEPGRKRPKPEKTPDSASLDKLQVVLFELIDQQAGALAKLGHGAVTVKTTVRFADGTMIERTAKHG